MENNKRRKAIGEVPMYSQRKALATKNCRRIESRQGTPVTREQRRKAVRKAKGVRLALYALVGSLSFGGGYATHKMLTEGSGVTQQKNEISIDANKADKDIRIDNMTNEGKLWLNGLKVNIEDALDNEQETLRKTVQQEIESLENPEDVLNYVKQIYVEEYNECNNDNINIENVTFGKNKADIVIYSDKAENGDSILRCCSEHDAQEMGIGIDGDKSVISAHIKDGEISQTERVAQNNKGEYQAIYSKSEEVKQNDETVLEDVAAVVLTGIDMATSMEQKENNSFEVNQKYKQRLIDAVVDHKNDQIQEIINGDTQIQKNQEDEGR